MSDDEKISQRYRELGAEEPPRALDDAILAAARRGRRRWYAPLAAAAVLVLAVAVTLHMQVEQPGIESPAPQVAPPVASARSDDSRRAASGATGMLARKTEERSSRDAQAMARAPQAALVQADTRERELERIATLRGQGRQDEADRALAEFRKRYPDYRITEEMRLRVERR